jgi:predicted transcriptional regulator
MGTEDMAEGSGSQKVNPNLVAEIVSSYVAKNSVPVDEVGGLIATIHQALSGLGNAEPAPGALVPAVPVRRSVQPDYVVCLECGFRAKTLRRHLRMRHGLEVGAYRARWKLPTDHPTTAPAYSERRSTMAKQVGLGRKSGSVEPSPAACRRGRSRQPVAE